MTPLTNKRNNHPCPSSKCTQVCITMLWLQQDRRVTWTCRVKESRMLASTSSRPPGSSSIYLLWLPKCPQVKQLLTFQKRLSLWIATYALPRRSTCFSEKREMQKWNHWFFLKYAPKSVYTSRKPTKATKSTQLWELSTMVHSQMFSHTTKDTTTLRHTCSKLKPNLSS